MHMNKIIANIKAFATAAFRLAGLSCVLLLAAAFSLRAHNGTRETELRVYYPFDNAVVHEDYLSNQETLRTLDSLYRCGALDGEQKLEIVSYSSPEGQYAYNVNLSKRRAEAFRRYIAAKYPSLAGRLTTNPDGESWDDLRAAVESDGRISEKARQLILEIIDSDARPDEKEARLKTVIAYKHLYSNYFRRFRYAYIRVSVEDSAADAIPERNNEISDSEKDRADSLEAARIAAQMAAAAKAAADKAKADSLAAAKAAAEKAAEDKAAADSLEAARIAAAKAAAAKAKADSLAAAAFHPTDTTLFNEADSLETADNFADADSLAKAAADSLAKAAADSLAAAKAAADSLATAAAKATADSLATAEVVPADTLAVKADSTYVRPKNMIAAVKTNLLYDAVTALNVEVEVPLGRHFSVMVEDVFPWWETGNKYCFQMWEMGLEGRYWFKGWDRISTEKLRGFFAGVYAMSSKYDFQWDRDVNLQGEYWSAGVSGGYAMAIGRRKRVNLEFSLAVGPMHTVFRHYQPTQSYDKLIRDPYNAGIDYKTGQWYFGPTKAKVSLVVPICVRTGKKEVRHD